MRLTIAGLMVRTAVVAGLCWINDWTIWLLAIVEWPQVEGLVWMYRYECELERKKTN